MSLLNEGWLLIVSILLVIYCIHELNKHNEKVEKEFADPNPNLPDQKLYWKRENLKINLIGHVILLILLVLYTIRFFISIWS